MLYNSPLEEFEEEVEVIIDEDVEDTGRGHDAQLIVYNDDHNTFEWVVECFMEVLGHDQTQSEQLSLIIHFKGKATVKTAPKKILKPKKDALIDRGLSAVIEGGEKDD
ncbi:MAG: ATP-dependent Clp protease adaptor ClpS [Bacteroidetes bacterium]|nr:MAG: ATP-dependent Clp protease adaptor ClpS [Bacteroidota bacterium]